MSSTLAPPHPLLDVFRRAEPLSGDELARMPDLGRCELVEGRLLLMSPTSWFHGRYVVRITAALEDFVADRDLGEVYSGEVGIYTGRDPDTVRGADVLFISHARLARVTSRSFLDVTPEVVVEAISPGNTADEMETKTREYLGAGAEQVWIIEPERKRVRVERAEGAPLVLGPGDVLRGEGLLDRFTLDLDVLFRA
ncbi:MAG: Uma2 family endonuclease [Bacteroidota bacterium]